MVGNKKMGRLHCLECRRCTVARNDVPPYNDDLLNNNATTK